MYVPHPLTRLPLVTINHVCDMTVNYDAPLQGSWTSNLLPSLSALHSEAEKERRWHEIRVRQHRLRHEGRNRPPSALKQSMLESGFTMNDIQGQWRRAGAMETGLLMDILCAANAMWTR